MKSKAGLTEKFNETLKGKTARNASFVGFWCPQLLVDRLDALRIGSFWTGQQPPSRSEMVRALLDFALEGLEKEQQHARRSAREARAASQASAADEPRKR